MIPSAAAAQETQKEVLSAPVNTDTFSSEIDDGRHYQFQIQTGNGKENLFIFMEASPFANPDDPSEERALTISIYLNEKKTSLLQQIKTTTIDAYFQNVKIEDVNFDGYMDFYWPTMKGASNWFYTYWIWDEDTHCFISDPYGLSSFSTPAFDAERQIILSQSTINWQAGTSSYWKYEGKKLVPIRTIRLVLPDYKTGIQVLSVEDFIENQMVEVYHVELSIDETEIEKEYEKVLKWNDLNYHGDTY